MHPLSHPRRSQRSWRLLALSSFHAQCTCAWRAFRQLFDAGKVCASALLLASPAVLALNPDKVPSQYVLNTWQISDGLPQNSPIAIEQSHDGYLWIGTQEGLARFDGVRFAVFDRRNTPAITSNLITALRADSRGRLWIGTGAGLAILERGAFRHFAGDSRLAATYVYDIMEARNGALWFATEAGLYQFDGKAITPPLPSPTTMPTSAFVPCTRIAMVRSGWPRRPMGCTASLAHA